MPGCGGFVVWKRRRRNNLDQGAGRIRVYKRQEFYLGQCWFCCLCYCADLPTDYRCTAYTALRRRMSGYYSVPLLPSEAMVNRVVTIVHRQRRRSSTGYFTAFVRMLAAAWLDYGSTIVVHGTKSSSQYCVTNTSPLCIF